MLVNKNPYDCKKLSISNISFCSKNEKPALKNFFRKWTYITNLTSPFGGLSGIKDNGVLKNNKYFFLNVIPELHIDNKVLPVFQLEKNLSDYALEFLLSKNTEACIKTLISKKYGHFIGDLFNYLKDFSIIFKNINNTFAMIAPVNDPVYLIFEKIESNLRFKYDEAIEIMVNLDQNLIEE